MIQRTRPRRPARWLARPQGRWTSRARQDGPSRAEFKPSLSPMPGPQRWRRATSASGRAEVAHGRLGGQLARAATLSRPASLAPLAQLTCKFNYSIGAGWRLVAGAHFAARCGRAIFTNRPGRLLAGGALEQARAEGHSPPRGSALTPNLIALARHCFGQGQSTLAAPLQETRAEPLLWWPIARSPARPAELAGLCRP